MVQTSRQPSDQASWLPLGYYHLHPPLPLSITQPGSRYSFYLLMHCSKSVQPVPMAVQHSSFCVCPLWDASLSSHAHLTTCPQQLVCGRYWMIVVTYAQIWFSMLIQTTFWIIAAFLTSVPLCYVFVSWRNGCSTYQKPSRYELQRFDTFLTVSSLMLSTATEWSGKLFAQGQSGEAQSRKTYTYWDSLEKS